jgi:two-component system chemotaxis response regulator CheB
MPGHDIIVMGASSGGIESLVSIAAGLPRNPPFAVFVVLHIPAKSESRLPRILSQAGPVPAVHPNDNDPIENGRIYIAPPDHHLVLADGHIRIVRGPKENHHRPAIDPLFRTAARFYGPRVVAVVLSGALDDGAAGLIAVRRARGIAVVQDPADAHFPDMPRNAMDAAGADYRLPKDQIAPLLVRLASEEVAGADRREVSDGMKKETEIEVMDMSTIEDEDRPGKPSVFGCPDCGGTLWELEENELLRFRCRVGHAFGSDGLLATQSEALDDALWSAFRALQENASLARRLGARAREHKSDALAETFDGRARIADARSEVIRHVLLSEDAGDAGKRNQTPRGA